MGMSIPHPITHPHQSNLVVELNRGSQRVTPETHTGEYVGNPPVSCLLSPVS